MSDNNSELILFENNHIKIKFNRRVVTVNQVRSLKHLIIRVTKLFFHLVIFSFAVSASIEEDRLKNTIQSTGQTVHSFLRWALFGINTGMSQKKNYLT